MTKTLDGKRAGFQAAKELREELEAHKQRDAELFSKVIVLYNTDLYKNNSFIHEDNKCQTVLQLVK